jgi:prefoldin subunit 5
MSPTISGSEIRIDITNCNDAISVLNKAIDDENSSKSKMNISSGIPNDLKCSGTQMLVDNVTKCVGDLNSQIEALKSGLTDVKQILRDFEDADRKIAQSEHLNSTLVYRR